MDVFTNCPHSENGYQYFPDTWAWVADPQNRCQELGYIPLGSLQGTIENQLDSDWYMAYDKIKEVTIRVKQDSRIVPTTAIDFLTHGPDTVEALHLQHLGIANLETPADAFVQALRSKDDFAHMRTLELSGNTILESQRTWRWIMDPGEVLDTLQLQAIYSDELISLLEWFTHNVLTPDARILHLDDIKTFHVEIHWRPRWQTEQTEFNIRRWSLVDGRDERTPIRPRRRFFVKLIKDFKKLKDKVEAPEPEEGTGEY